MATTTRERRTDGTFSTAYDASGRYELVREVAEAANSRNPRSTTQRQFDDARATAGHPDAPTARAICMSLKIGWTALLEIVFSDERNTPMSAAAHNRAWMNVPSEEEIYFALRFAAMRHDVKTLSYAEYEKWRDELVAADKRRHGNESVLEQALPRAGRIWNACGKDWNYALTVAGLAVRGAVKHQYSIALDDIYDAFVRWTGARPQGWLTLDRLAQMLSVPMSRKLGRKPFPQVEKSIISRRKKAGLATPKQVMNMGEAKKLPLPDDLLAATGADARTPRKPKRDWTYETVLGCLAEYVKTLPAGARASQHDYQARRKGKQWPAVRKIQEYAPWSAMLAAARALAQTGVITPIEELV
jgi:hypothetical protein